MRILVCGGRTFQDWDKLNETLNTLHAIQPITCIIEGGARGADRLARLWAQKNGVRYETYASDWKNISYPDSVIRYDAHGQPYDANAGPRRNKKMLEEGKPDLVVGFKGSKGTMDCLKQAKNMGIQIARAG